MTSYWGLKPCYVIELLGSSFFLLSFPWDCWWVMSRLKWDPVFHELNPKPLEAFLNPSTDFNGSWNQGLCYYQKFECKPTALGVKFNLNEQFKLPYRTGVYSVQHVESVCYAFSVWLMTTTLWFMAHAMLSIAVLSLSSVNEAREVIKAASIDCSHIFESTYLETISFPTLEEALLRSDPISVEVICVNK